MEYTQNYYDVAILSGILVVVAIALIVTGEWRKF